MKRAVLVAVALAAIVGGIDVLADLTQDRPDKVAPGSRSVIVLTVESRDRRGSDLLAAEGLWGACHGNVWQRLVEPGVEDVGDGLPEKPGTLLTAVSRVLDAPRRIWSRLG